MAVVMMMIAEAKVAQRGVSESEREPDKAGEDKGRCSPPPVEVRQLRTGLAQATASFTVVRLRAVRCRGMP